MSNALPPRASPALTASWPLGSAAQRLAEHIGSTPFFAYDRKLLDRRVELLPEVLALNRQAELRDEGEPDASRRAAPGWSRRRHGCRLGQEMAVALDTLLRPEQISFAGPGKTVAEIRQAVAAGLIIELESALEAAAGRCWRCVCGPGGYPSQPELQGQGLRHAGWAEARSSSAWIANKYQPYLPTWRQLRGRCPGSCLRWLPEPASRDLV